MSAWLWIFGWLLATLMIVVALILLIAAGQWLAFLVIDHTFSYRPPAPDVSLIEEIEIFLESQP